MLSKLTTARAITENNYRELWTEEHKTRSKNSTISKSIDDVSDDVNIANLFSDKYSVLYNSAPFEQSNENSVIQHCVNKSDSVLFKRTHNSLLHTINNCLSIDLLLEKRCIKFIWNLFNSAYELHKSIIRGSFYNKGSSIAENIRYFMYKYNISMYDWEKPLNVLMKKVYNYASLHSNVDDICTATAIVDLCRDRDNHRYDVFTHSDIIDIIQMLCTC